MNAIKNNLLRLKFEYRSRVGSDPRLWLLHKPNVWHQQYKILRHYRKFGATIQDCVVTSRTEFVIDGFQGSGNSFISAAFERSQSRPVRMAHHMHSPAQIIRAIEMRVPTVVTIREPVGAVSSLVSRWPYVSITQALTAYMRFYSMVEPHAERYVLSTFDQTTTNFNQVVLEVNRRFGCDFDLLSRSQVETVVARRNHAKKESEEEKRRQTVKEEVKQAVLRRANERLRGQATALYKRMVCYGVGRA